MPSAVIQPFGFVQRNGRTSLSSAVWDHTAFIDSGSEQAWLLQFHADASRYQRVKGPTQPSMANRIASTQQDLKETPV